MIDAIVRWATARLEAFLNWFWDLTTPPDWLITAIDQAATFIGSFSGLGHWIPVTLIGIAIGGVAAVWAIGMIVQVVRIILSFITLGGGAT